MKDQTIDTMLRVVCVVGIVLVIGFFVISMAIHNTTYKPTKLSNGEIKQCYEKCNFAACNLYCENGETIKQATNYEVLND